MAAGLGRIGRAVEEEQDRRMPRNEGNLIPDVSGSIAGRKKEEGIGDRRSKQIRKAEEEDEQRSSSSRILSGYKTDWFSPLPLGIHILDMPLWAIDTGTGPSGTLGPWAGVISNANTPLLLRSDLPPSRCSWKASTKIVQILPDGQRRR